MIVGLTGTLGNAKTLTTVFLAKYWLSITDINYVVSNFDTEFTTHKVNNPKELDEISEEFKDQGIEAIYLLDEIWAWMNSRKSGENDLMTEIVLNSRKRGAVVIWTSQRKGLVDLNLTENTDYYASCQHIKKQYAPYDHDTAIIQMVKNTEPPTLGRKFIYNAEPYYGLYDTDEEVSTVDDVEQYEDQIEDLKNRVSSGEFEYKKELISYLSMKKYSNAQAERMADEIFRQIRIEEKADDSIDQDQDDSGVQSTL